MIPVVQLELPTTLTKRPMPLAALQQSDLGQTTAAGWSLPLGMLSLRVHWHADRLILSTAMDVLPFSQQTGSFTDHQIVKIP